jgi:DNA mismatch endonuclease (patch repair protein)
VADKHSGSQRSYNMSRIRKFGNESTEVRLLRLFRQRGIHGWRRHLPLPGRPDFTFRGARVVVFVDGCFWHCCPVCNWKPSSNTHYWEPKLARNVQKDRAADEALRKKGWRVVRIWEHVLRQQPDEVLSRISDALSRERGEQGTQE